MQPSNPPSAAGSQPALLNLRDLVPTLKPSAATVPPADRRRLWLQVRQSLHSLRDTITSQWESHRSRPEDLDFRRMDLQLASARTVATQSIFDMDKFLAAAERIIASLKRIAAKGSSTPAFNPRPKEETGEASSVSAAAEESPSPPRSPSPRDGETCPLKKVRRELDQVKGSRDKLMQELTSLASKKTRLEEDFKKFRKEMVIAKQELSRV